MAFDEWAPMAAKRLGADLPASVVEQLRKEVPDGSDWAVIGDARRLWALGPDGVLLELTLEAGGTVNSTTRALAGRLTTVSHTTSLVEPYQHTETRQRHYWKFSVDGTQLLELTGTVYGERGRPRDRPDRQHLLALALHDLAGRSRQ